MKCLPSSGVCPLFSASIADSGFAEDAGRWLRPRPTTGDAFVSAFTCVYADALAAQVAIDLRQGRALGERFVAIAAVRDALRIEIAALLGCKSDQVFLTRSTGGGLEQIIDAMPLAVAFETGQLLPLADIAAMARKRGIRCLIDGAQCAGAAPLDPGEAGIDFLAIPLQKWLLGPEGLGALYVREPEKHGLRRPPRWRSTPARPSLRATRVPC